MNKSLQVHNLEKMLKAKGIDPKTVDLHALVDENLSFHENLQNIERTLGISLKETPVYFDGAVEIDPPEDTQKEERKAESNIIPDLKTALIKTIEDMRPEDIKRAVIFALNDMKAEDIKQILIEKLERLESTKVTRAVMRILLSFLLLS